MGSVSPVSVYSENIQTTQPFLSKRGLILQGKAVNLLSGVEKIATQETASHPQTPQQNAIDTKV